MQKSEYSTEIITVFCMSDSGAENVSLQISITVSFGLEPECSSMCARKKVQTFKDQAVFQEE